MNNISPLATLYIIVFVHAHTPKQWVSFAIKHVPHLQQPANPFDM